MSARSLSIEWMAKSIGKFWADPPLGMFRASDLATALVDDGWHHADTCAGRIDPEEYERMRSLAMTHLANVINLRARAEGLEVKKDLPVPETEGQVVSDPSLGRTLAEEEAAVNPGSRWWR